MKFASGADIDFTKLKNGSVKMERENNLKEYRSANDIDVAPKYGAGSVFGQEEKEEARRRKYGIMRQKYDSEKQPWLMKVGSGKQAKKYKGVREGTISDNTSYYIFTQKPSGAFEAFPISEWYTYNQVIKYKYLNSEEAEDEFTRRDKTFNLFNVMLKKRLTNEEDKNPSSKQDPELPKQKKSKRDKDFLLTEMDEWAIISDNEEAGDMDEDELEKKKQDSDDENTKQKNNKGKKSTSGDKRPKNAKQNSDDEAIEESDEGDFDDREVDYITDSDSLSEPEEKNNDDKGVAEEHGLRKLIDSGDESEEEETKEEEENIDNEDKKNIKSDNGSASSSSDSSDSDLDKDLTSPIFIQQKSLAKSTKPPSRSTTPLTILDGTDPKGSSQKRKGELPDTSSSKKPRTESPNLLQNSASEAITEEAVRRYLTRKPMTTKDLLQKFKSKKMNMPTEQMATTITQILKKINPDKNYVNKTLYLSLKSTGMSSV